MLDEAEELSEVVSGAKTQKLLSTKDPSKDERKERRAENIQPESAFELPIRKSTQNTFSLRQRIAMLRKIRFTIMRQVTTKLSTFCPRVQARKLCLKMLLNARLEPCRG